MVKPETGQANLDENRNPPRLALALDRVGELGHRQAIGKFERRLEALGEARAHVRPDDNAVDDHLDVVLELLVERRRIGDLVELAVDLQPLEAALHIVGDFLAVFALPAAHHRREQIEARPLRQSQHPVDHLAHRLALDRQAGCGRIGNADPRPEQAHIVVDLGHRAHGRARVLRGRLLLDRDRRREAVDLVDVRLLHHFEELARIGREQLDIAALALRIDRVEGERGLARAREAGEHDQLVARDGEIDVLEVVLARAADRRWPGRRTELRRARRPWRARTGRACDLGPAMAVPEGGVFLSGTAARDAKSRLRGPRADARTNVEQGQRRFRAPGPEVSG